MGVPRRRSGPQLTRELAAKIKALHAHTPLNQAEIAAKLGGLNQGRVSEVLNGARFKDVPPAALGDI